MEYDKMRAVITTIGKKGEPLSQSITWRGDLISKMLKAGGGISENCFSKVTIVITPANVPPLPECDGCFNRIKVLSGNLECCYAYDELARLDRTKCFNVNFDDLPEGFPDSCCIVEEEPEK